MTATEIISIITAVTAFVAAVGVVLVNLKTAKVNKDLTAVQGDVSHVKVLVNQQKTDSDEYQAKLINALQNAGVTVPDDESQSISEQQAAARARKHK
jgi:cob(I)alamin adenosyltransferase